MREGPPACGVLGAGREGFPMIYVNIPFFLALIFMATVGPVACFIAGASLGRPDDDE